MKISLIMPTYNKSPRLKIVLISLLYLKANDDLEVIIVDDGSSDDTLKILREFQVLARAKGLRVNVLSGENGGRSVARNRGIQAARGQLLIFSDDDLVFAPDFIQEHSIYHQQGRKLVVRGAINDLPFLKFFKDPLTGELYDNLEASVGKGLLAKKLTLEMIEPPYPELSKQSRSSKFEKDIRELYAETSPDHPLRWIGCTGGNFSVAKEVVEQVGGFDPALGREWGCEDLELGYRLKEYGCDFLMALGAENYHLSHYRAGFSTAHQRAMDYFYAKHPDPALRELNEYFNGHVISLSHWKDRVSQLG